jgi:hypothetical protein
MIDQGDVLPGGIGDLRKHPPRRAQQPLDADVLTTPRHTHRGPNRNVNFARQYTDSEVELCANLVYRRGRIEVEKAAHRC